MLLDKNTARTMTTVAGDPRPRHADKGPSPAMLDLLAAMRAGAVLVTAERKSVRSRTAMLAELDGEPAAVASVRGLVKRGLIRVRSRTARTTTWEPNE